MSEKVFFGFKKVDKDKKQSLVNDIFSNVASKYDMMNDVMSFGIHRYWKNILMSEIDDFSKKIIDVAGGTGDISQRIYQHAIKNDQNPDITIFDINQEMLMTGRDKLLNKGMLKGLSFVCGNAENLPFADESFDYYICAFGIRNMTNLTTALTEAQRVLKKGGKFICLEFSHISNDNMMSKLYDIYSMHLIPFFGEFVANDRESYKYLVESIKKFPTQRKFLEMLKDAGFNQVKYDNLTCGVCAIHTGYKIDV
jgi:ubiquinone/menaquinone biosynthesis methyltransferase